MKNLLATTWLACALSGPLIFAPLNSARADADDAKQADGAAESAVKRNANGEMTITVDIATQKRIKLETASPTVTAWKPTVTGYGRVLDPTPLAAAVMDLAAARLNAEASAKEYERTKTLANQNNAAPRALEAAHFAAEHDRLTVESARAKFAGDWGLTLAGRDDLADFIQPLVERKNSLVRVILPAGEHLSGPPTDSTVTVFPSDNDPIPAELIELNLGVDQQTQGQVLLFQVKDHLLPLGAAVTGRLGYDGKPLAGVMVPTAAVLRHDGLGWVYLQTADDQFTRHEIPLDRMAPNGWFIENGLSATNTVVISGAETILSAELSGGGFNTGTRD